MGVSLFRRGSVWWAQWREAGVRVRRSLEAADRRLAEEKRVELEYQQLRARSEAGQETEETRVPIAQLVEEYAAWSRAHKRPKTVLNDRARIGTFLAFARPLWVQGVSTRDVMQYLAQRSLKDLVQPTTLLREREILHALLNFALRCGYVDSNPVSAVPRPKLPTRDPRFLSLDQIAEVLDAVAGDEIAPLVATAIYAGLRREELCWLTWEDLDQVGDRQLLRVRCKVVEGVEWMPKTKRDRGVPVSTKLGVVLAGLTRRPDCRWLFPSPQGHRWDPDNLSRRFRQRMKQAGLPWNLQVLRHTFGSQLAKRGRSLLKIAQLMGNSPEIARRHYINLVPEEMMVDVEF